MQQERICRNNKNYESFKQDFAVSIKIDFLLQSSAIFMKLKLELRLTALKFTLKPVVVALTTIFKRGFPILRMTKKTKLPKKSGQNPMVDLILFLLTSFLL